MRNLLKTVQRKLSVGAGGEFREAPWWASSDMPLTAPLTFTCPLTKPRAVCDGMSGSPPPHHPKPNPTSPLYGKGHWPSPLGRGSALQNPPPDLKYQPAPSGNWPDTIGRLVRMQDLSTPPIFLVTIHVRCASHGLICPQPHPSNMKYLPSCRWPSLPGGFILSFPRAIILQSFIYKYADPLESPSFSRFAQHNEHSVGTSYHQTSFVNLSHPAESRVDFKAHCVQRSTPLGWT